MTAPMSPERRKEIDAQSKLAADANSGALLEPRRVAIAINHCLAEIDRLKAALDHLVILCGKTGDSMEDFEIAAELYHRETRRLRPGKDLPMHSCEDDDPDVRRRLWDEWVRKKIQAARDALGTQP